MADIGQAFMAPVLANQEYVQRENAQPAELKQKAASARYTTAMADKLETDTAAEKKVAGMLAQFSGAAPQAGGTGSISERLNAMADMWAKAGSPTKAAAISAQAAQAASHEATARAAQVRQAIQQTQLQGKQVEQATKLLNGVTDEASWKAANDTFAQATGQPSPFAGIPYDPKVVALLKDSAETAYQKQQIALRETALKATLADTASKISSRGTRDGVALERLRVSQQREQRLAKAGGKDIGSPGKSEVEAAGRLLKDEGLEGDEQDTAAFSIASEAKVIRRKNPGVSADEAMRQAYTAAKQQGAFVPGEKHILSRNVPGQFVKPLSGAPMEIPKSGKAADLVKGQLYTQGGKTAMWTGKGWQVKGEGAAATPAAKPIPGGSSDGEDPGEDDDE